MLHAVLLYVAVFAGGMLCGASLIIAWAAHPFRFYTTKRRTPDHIALMRSARAAERKIENDN